mmetsp:Transcript_9652/g.17395  ORF Transcript_9652/g.17395 Transcript_9652/m.17395 type:complete len:118 (-) Transcript_9652:702-1055(-)
MEYGRNQRNWRKFEDGKNEGRIAGILAFNRLARRNCIRTISGNHRESHIEHSDKRNFKMKERVLNLSFTLFQIGKRFWNANVKLKFRNHRLQPQESRLPRRLPYRKSTKSSCPGATA